MARALLFLLDKYGLGVLNLGLLAYVSWRLATNHLRHLREKLETVIQGQEKLTKEVGQIKERVSTIEGQLKKS
ncbi:hypothetical protein LCGC14_1279720 [marine sediment metagenome]|uniref:Uncharacterized protein n=1 Tax=marine sediment metagenome TaxID=412755 RepID=A0A0F9LGW8_9ZZZZ